VLTLFVGSIRARKCVSSRPSLEAPLSDEFHRQFSHRIAYLANERDSGPAIFERNVGADPLQVNFGFWGEVRAHSLHADFGHSGVRVFQSVKHLGVGFQHCSCM